MQPSVKRVKTILFLCTGNSCRSQMAEGFLKHYGGRSYRVYSAGTNPAGVNPKAVKVMDEIGIDISGQSSDAVTGSLLEKADLLITLCGDAQESCPVLTVNIEVRHWPLEDPARAKGDQQEVMEQFRKVRDRIKRNVLQFIQEGR